MKKLIFFFFSFLLISSAKAGEKNKNEIQVSITSVGEKFYPRIFTEHQGSFCPNSTLGLWSLFEYSGLPYIPQSWRDKGYISNNKYNLNVKIGVTYGYIYGKFIVGAGYSCNKRSFGPLMGFSFKRNKIYFETLGLFATNTAYKSEYSLIEEIIPQIYIKEFDPNSWYKVKLLYAVFNRLDIGIISERFYGTLLTTEYNISGNLKIKFGFGRDLEFQEKVLNFGLSFEL